MPDVSRREPVGMITLRGDPADPALVAAVEAAVGCAPPTVRRVAFGARGGVAWMSPDEVMLFVPHGVAGRVAAAISAALTGVHHLAVDVSDARMLFRVEGQGARTLLAKGAPADLDPQAFALGDFRRTRLGQVAVAFWMPALETFDLMCFRSVADFVSDWLASAAGSDRKAP